MRPWLDNMLIACLLLIIFIHIQSCNAKSKRENTNKYGICVLRFVGFFRRRCVGILKSLKCLEVWDARKFRHNPGKRKRSSRWKIFYVQIMENFDSIYARANRISLMTLFSKYRIVEIFDSRPIYVVVLTSALEVSFDVKRAQCNWTQTRTLGMRVYMALQKDRCQAKFLTFAKFLTYSFLSDIFLLRAKKIKFVDYFFDVCCVNENFLVSCRSPTASYSTAITITTEKYWTYS